MDDNTPMQQLHILIVCLLYVFHNRHAVKNLGPIGDETELAEIKRIMTLLLHHQESISPRTYVITGATR